RSASRLVARGGHIQTRVRNALERTACPACVFPVPLSEMVAPYSTAARQGRTKKHYPFYTEYKLPRRVMTAPVSLAHSPPPPQKESDWIQLVSDYPLLCAVLRSVSPTKEVTVGSYIINNLP